MYLLATFTGMKTKTVQFWNPYCTSFEHSHQIQRNSNVFTTGTSHHFPRLYVWLLNSIKCCFLINQLRNAPIRRACILPGLYTRRVERWYGDDSRWRHLVPLSTKLLPTFPTVHVHGTEVDIRRVPVRIPHSRNKPGCVSTDVLRQKNVFGTRSCPDVKVLLANNVLVPSTAHDLLFCNTALLSCHRPPGSSFFLQNCKPTLSIKFLECINRRPGRALAAAQKR